MDKPELFDQHQIVLQELKNDYEFVSEQIRLVRQQIQESIDLALAANLKKKLERLRMERRKLGEEIIALQTEIDNQPSPVFSPAETEISNTKDDEARISTKITRQNEIEQLIATHSRRLQIRKEQLAIYGISADPSILIEIEVIEAEPKQLQTQLKALEKESSTAKSEATKVSADNTNKVSANSLSVTPNWIAHYPDIHPLPTDDADSIATMLKGHTPFPHHRAEVELPFLFGSTGGFWSGHPVYAQITGNPVAQVVLAEAGAGKTALAYALRQVGTPDGNPIPHTLPVVFSETGSLPPAKAQNHIAETILTLLHHHPALLASFSTEEKTVVVQFMVNHFGPAEVTRQLQPAIRQDPGLRGIISRFSQTKPQASTGWLKQTKTVLELLNFRQIVLAIDANRQPSGEINDWLKRLPSWEIFAVKPVLFLPLDRQHDFESPLIQASTVRVLTWTERQLEAMVTWRFERLVNRIGVHLSLEELFEERILMDFVHVSNRNPRRMAQLWEKMAQHHAENLPDSRIFTADDLLWAVEQVG
jgi:hypothetical protein